MSARPRPVTGTYYEPVTSTPKQRRYSLSSGTSTESLISILNHDSYESPMSSEEEQGGLKPEVQVKQKEQPQSAEPEKQQTTETTQSPSQSEITASCTEVDTEKDDGQQQLTPWEKWLIQKSKELRLKQKKETERKKKEKQQKVQQEEEKNQKKQVIDEKIKQWMERKSMEDKVKRKETKIKKQTENELKQQEKEQLEEKVRAKYIEWMNQKKIEQKEKNKKEKEKKKESEQKEQERQKRSEEAFEAWCQKAKKRPKSAPRSFGYTSGKLTGYHDTNAYPIPSFYNPIPWQPIHVPPPPKSAQPKKKKVKKYAWNPNKYL